MSTRSLTLRNAMFSSVGLYTEFALGMLTSIVIARHLGPNFFGAYSGAVWLMAMGVAIANAGTAGAAIRFVAELRGRGEEERIHAALAYLRRAQRRVMLAVLLACLALMAAAGNRLVPSLDAWIVMGFLAATIPLRASYMFNIGIAKGFENFRANAVVALVAAPVNLLLVLLVAWAGLSVYWQLAAFFASSVLFYEISRRQVRTLLPPAQPAQALPPELLHRIRHHVVYTGLAVAVGFIVSSDSEVLFLNMYQDEHGAGQFKVAFQLASGAANLVPGVFGALMLPMMAGALTRGREVAGRKFAASTTYLGLLALPLIAFGLVFATSLVRLLYGQDYVEAGPALAICLAATSLTAMTTAASSLLLSADRQRTVLVVIIACGVLKVSLDWLLIHHAGLAGAVWAFATVSLVQAVALTVLATRTSGVWLEWKRLVRILVAAAIAGVVVLPVHAQLAVLPGLLLGVPLFGFAYLACTLVLGCWSRGDIEYLQSLFLRLAPRRQGALGGVLAWAHRRAYREVAG